MPRCLQPLQQAQTCSLRMGREGVRVRPPSGMLGTHGLSFSSLWDCAHPVKPARISLTLISKPADLQQKASAPWIQQATGALVHLDGEADSIPKMTLPGLSFPIEPNDHSLWPRGPHGAMQPSSAPSVHQHTPDHTRSDPCPGTGRRGAHSVELIPRAPLHGISHR